MSNDHDAGRQGSKRTLAAWLRAMPRWKKGMVGAAAAAFAIGGIWWLVAGGSAPAPGTGGGGGPGMTGSGAAGFVPSGTHTGTGNGTPTATASEPAAKGVFRLGSSFLVGFCIGAFVRTAVKMASIAIGFFLVALFLLDQGGFVTVDWTAIDQAWGSFWSRVGEEWGDFQTFVTGRLPAAGLATLGLYAGFKKH